MRGIIEKFDRYCNPTEFDVLIDLNSPTIHRRMKFISKFIRIKFRQPECIAVQQKPSLENHAVTHENRFIRYN